MNNTEDYFILKPCQTFDYVLLLIGAIALIASYIQETHWFTLFCLGWLAIIVYGIKNGKIELESKFNIEDKKIFQIEKDGNHIYILAQSEEEAQLMMEIDNIEGDISYLGKIKYFN